jgi:hypothetical protein
MRLAAVALGIAFANVSATSRPSRITDRSVTPAVQQNHVPKDPPMLPSIERVRVDIAGDRVLLLEEIVLPRGDWQSGDLDLFAAFGVPGPPLALDAHLLEVPPDGSQAGAGDSGESVPFLKAPRALAAAGILLGKPKAAGVVIRVRESLLRRTYLSSNLAVLRIRSLVRIPAAEPDGTRQLVVRLGRVGDTPITLRRIELSVIDAKARLVNAQARLCGPSSDPWPLRVTVEANAKWVDRSPAIAPSMAVRHSSDDLCVTWRSET